MSEERNIDVNSVLFACALQAKLWILQISSSPGMNISPDVPCSLFESIHSCPEYLYLCGN
jgi:hypothetical protein